MALHISVSTLPAVVLNDDIPYKGLYTNQGWGVITLKSDAGCEVFAHEMIHHLQYERNGYIPDWNTNEWWKNEIKAKELETRFITWKDNGSTN